jgi:hypothetical protein
MLLSMRDCERLAGTPPLHSSSKSQFELHVASSTEAAILDARIEHITNSPYFDELRRSRATGGSGSLDDDERWEQLRQLTLALVVSRATMAIFDGQSGVFARDWYDPSV